MSDTASITVYAQGHPVNSCVLYPMAVPYVAVDGGTPQRLRWGRSNAYTFTGLAAGNHDLLFELRYKGFKNPVTRATETVALEGGETVEYRVRNGWSNQHPFTFRRVS
ncbi:hypothetical protein ABLE92_17860 [Gordonia sp. VNQ95]|uniref:hypothetical protein n=1 Tax=Gordonia TaxID=2053 RepID=UPI0032B42804